MPNGLKKRKKTVGKGLKRINQWQMGVKESGENQCHSHTIRFVVESDARSSAEIREKCKCMTGYQLPPTQRVSRDDSNVVPLENTHEASSVSLLCTHLRKASGSKTQPEGSP